MAGDFVLVKTFARVLIPAVFFIVISWMVILESRRGQGVSSNVYFFKSSTEMDFLRETERDAAAFYASSKIQKNVQPEDFLEFGHRLRLFSKIFNVYVSLHSSKDREGSINSVDSVKENTKDDSKMLLERGGIRTVPYPESPTLWEMEKQLFPWAHYKFSSLLGLRDSFRGKGIVIPTGSYHLRFAIHLTRQIRLLGCSLPVMVVYSGKSDLKPEEISYLEKLGVETMDLSTMVDSEELQLAGWQIKPYALLLAPFEEVILADADVVFLQNPSLLLEDPEYLKSGALIYPDRTIASSDSGRSEWLEVNLPHPLSEKVLNSRMYKKTSFYEQESGVLVWNKRKNFIGLLAACKMNAKKEREKVTYKQFHGDKESFWIGLEMAEQSYTMMQPTPGVIGSLEYEKGERKELVCGTILHFDRGGWPLWFNGAIVQDKNVEEKLFVRNFTHYAKEGSWHHGVACLDKDVTPLSEVLKERIAMLGLAWTAKIDYKKESSGDTVG